MDLVDIVYEDVTFPKWGHQHLSVLYLITYIDVVVDKNVAWFIALCTVSIAGTFIAILILPDTRQAKKLLCAILDIVNNGDAGSCPDQLLGMRLFCPVPLGI